MLNALDLATPIACYDALFAYAARRLGVAGEAIRDLSVAIEAHAEVRASERASSVEACLADARRLAHEGRVLAAVAWVADALCYIPNDGEPYTIRNAARALRSDAHVE